MYQRFCRLLSFLVFSVASVPAVILKTPPPPTTPTLQQLTKKAGYIFSGTVLSIERVPPKSQNEVATVQITFRVNQAIRGVSSRQILTILEWAGLWDSGDRYRRGEHVLLFLYQPSRLGLTSPVSGDFGRFKLDSRGRIMLNATRLQALQIDKPTPLPASRGTITVNSRDLVRAINRSRD